MELLKHEGKTNGTFKFKCRSLVVHRPSEDRKSMVKTTIKELLREEYVIRNCVCGVSKRMSEIKPRK